MEGLCGGEGGVAVLAFLQIAKLTEMNKNILHSITVKNKGLLEVK
jgi:hypothetical protein